MRRMTTMMSMRRGRDEGLSRHDDEDVDDVDGRHSFFVVVVVDDER